MVLRRMDMMQGNRINRAKFTTKIIVIGVGGAGNNAVSRMAGERTVGVEFVGMDTDKASLYFCGLPKALQIGRKLTGGLGTGAVPETGEKAARESRKEITAMLKGADLAFVICGRGGGTGTGAAPVVSGLAKDMGIFTMGCVSMPFRFESKARMLNAANGIERLKGNVDILLAFSGDKWLETSGRMNYSASEICKRMDEVFQQAVQGIIGLTKASETINLSFTDVQDVIREEGIIQIVSVMEGSGEMGSK